MKNKTKILFGSTLAAAVGVVTPLVTLVSCNKNHAELINILDKKQTVKGELTLTFNAVLSQVLDEQSQITGQATQITSTPGWKIDFDPVQGQGTNEITLTARLSPIEGAIPHDGEVFNFDVEFTCTGQSGVVWTHKIKSFEITYECGEGGVVPFNKFAYTVANNLYAILEFDLSQATYKLDNYEIKLLNIVPETDKGIKGIKLNATYPYQRYENTLYVCVELEPKTTVEDITDGAKANFDIKIVGLDQGKSVWQQTMTGFEVDYTDAWMVPVSETQVITPDKIEAGVISSATQYEYKTMFYVWDALTIDDIEDISATVADEQQQYFNVVLNKEGITESRRGGYKVFEIPTTVSLKQGASPDDIPDQNILFEISVDFNDSQGETHPEWYSGFQVPYISAKTKGSVTENTVCTLAGETTGQFEINVIDFASEIDTVKGVDVEANIASESKNDAVYYGEQLDPSIKGSRSLSFVIQPKEAELFHDDAALFKIVLKGKNADGNVVWKQTISAPEDQFLKLIYKDTWKIQQPNIETNFNQKSAEWVISIPTNEYEISSANITFDQESTIKVKLDTPQRKENYFILQASVVETSDKAPYNGFASGMLTLNGTDELGRALPEHSIPYRFEYNGGIIFNEDESAKEKKTEIGKISANFQFLVQSQKDWIFGKEVKYSLKPQSGTTAGVTAQKLEDSFTITDSFDGLINITVGLKREDGALINGDTFCFDVCFQVGEQPLEPITGFSLAYKGIIADGPKDPVGTGLGEDTAVFEFTSNTNFPKDTTSQATSKSQGTGVTVIENEVIDKTFRATVKLDDISGLKDGELVPFELTFNSNSAQWVERYINLNIQYNAPQLKGTDIVKATQISDNPLYSNTVTLHFIKIEGMFEKEDRVELYAISPAGSLQAQIETSSIDFAGGENSIDVPVHLFGKESLNIGDSLEFAIQVHFVSAGGKEWTQIINGCKITIDESHVSCTKPELTINDSYSPAALFTPTATFTFSLAEEAGQMGEYVYAEIVYQEQPQGVIFAGHPAKIACENDGRLSFKSDHKTATLNISFVDAEPIYDGVFVNFALRIWCTGVGGQTKWEQIIPNLKLTYAYNMFPSVEPTTNIQVSKDSPQPSEIKLFTSEYIGSADRWYASIIDGNTGKIIAGTDVVVIEAITESPKHLKITIPWSAEMISDLKVGDKKPVYVMVYPEDSQYNEPAFICTTPFTVELVA